MKASQADRCSDQRHLWRRDWLGYMACPCGAVHPDDLTAYLLELRESR